MAIHCVLRPARLSDGGLTHMEKTGAALSFSEPHCVVPSWESWEARRPASSWISAKQPINAAWSQWKSTSLFLSTHLSLWSARICNTHLGNDSLLFLHFTFCFQDCFSPQSPLNKHKSALPWFSHLFFHAGLLVCHLGWGWVG